MKLLALLATGFLLSVLGAGVLITLEYESILEEIQVRGLSELQRYQNLQQQLAQVHLQVTGLMDSGLQRGDEIRIYQESKKIADTLDSLLVASSSPDPRVDVLAAVTSTNLRKAIEQYRSEILLSLEMLTVNPALSTRHLLRAAGSQSRMNLALATSFERRREGIEEKVQADFARALNKIRVVGLGAVVATAIALFVLASIARRLARNFASLSAGMVSIGTETPASSLPGSSGDGEFSSIADGLARLRQVLEERDFARAQMEAIFNSILEGVLVIDEEGTIVRANPMAGKLFGYVEGALPGRNVSLLMPREDAARHDEYLARSRAGGTVRIIGQTRNLEGLRRDGSRFPIQLSVSQVMLGTARHFVGVIVDITQQVESERLLREARDAALSSTRLKAEFLATMSHEIRTPMNGILGMAQLLASGGISEEAHGQCTRTLLASSQTLLTLLNDILDLSKVEAGRLALKEEAAAPASLAEDVAALFAEAAQAKGLRLSVSASETTRERFLVDPTRVRQMLSNLVGNAVKFTAKGGVAIETSVEQPGTGERSILFRVNDTGPGISPADVPRLFEKYSQLDSSTTKRHGGSGLGLSIVRQFALAMKGEVGIDALPEGGSSFWFRLPARVPTGADAPVSGPPESAPQSRKAVFGGHVLVAEDVGANRLFIQLALHRLGLETTVAENGRIALEAFASKGPFDCVFMDMRMPEMDGEEATLAIRQFEASRNLRRCPIIAITANAYAEDRETCFRSGMDDFLAKPVNLSDLRSILERWLPSGAGDSRSPQAALVPPR